MEQRITLDDVVTTVYVDQFEKALKKNGLEATDKNVGQYHKNSDFFDKVALEAVEYGMDVLAKKIAKNETNS